MTTTLARIPALTIRRPWAQWLITGIKTRENRGWSTAYRGWFIVHAGQAWEPGALTLALDHDIDLPAEQPTGFLGVARLPDIHQDDACTQACGPWCFPDQFHWECVDARPFPEPIPGNGRQRWFNPPEHVQDAARQLLAVTT